MRTFGRIRWLPERFPTTALEVVKVIRALPDGDVEVVEYDGDTITFRRLA